MLSTAARDVDVSFFSLSGVKYEFREATWLLLWKITHFSTPCKTLRRSSSIAAVLLQGCAISGTNDLRGAWTGMYVRRMSLPQLVGHTHLLLRETCRVKKNSTLARWKNSAAQLSLGKSKRWQPALQLPNTNKLVWPKLALPRPLIYERIEDETVSMHTNFRLNFLKTTRRLQNVCDLDVAQMDRWPSISDHLSPVC